MKKSICLLFSSVLIISLLISCGKKKESPMVDMDSINNDGSHDDKYIFRKEIEKDEKREKRYKKDKF